MQPVKSVIVLSFNYVLDEKGPVEKSAQYWPSSKEDTETFGHVQVKVLEEKILPELENTVSRTLELTGMFKNFRVHLSNCLLLASVLIKYC